MVETIESATEIAGELIEDYKHLQSNRQFVRPAQWAGCVASYVNRPERADFKGHKRWERLVHETLELVREVAFGSTSSRKIG